MGRALFVKILKEQSYQGVKMLGIDAKAVIEVLQKLVPHVNLTGIELKLTDTIKFAETVNINLHIEQDSNKSTAIITPNNNDQTHTIDEHSVIIFPQSNISQPNPQTVPFSSGSHLIVNQKSWWVSQEHIRLGHIKIIPVKANEMAMVETLEIKLPRRFKFYYKANDLIEVNIWSDSQTQELRILPRNTIKINIEGSEWSFEVYSCDNIIKFETNTNIVLSFDKHIVEKAFLLTRIRSLLEPEYYVFVVLNTKKD